MSQEFTVCINRPVSWPRLPPKKDRPEPCLQTQLFRLEQQLTALCVAFLLWYYLTMVIAAAATAVLTDVPGTMLLSDVLTSTATRKRLPTGSTCWGQIATVREVKWQLTLQLAVFFDGLWEAVIMKRTHHKTLVKGRVHCLEDAAVWFPFCFTLIALASFVVFRRQE